MSLLAWVALAQAVKQPPKFRKLRFQMIADIGSHSTIEASPTGSAS